MIPLLYFSNTHARGGVEEHILSLLWRLDRRIFRFAFACTPTVAAQVRRDMPHDVDVFEIELNHPGQIGGVIRLVSLIRRMQPGILHSHMFQSSAVASPIGKLCGVPVVMETPHVRERWRHGVIKGRYFIDRWVGRAVDRYIAVSAANASYLIQEKGLPARKVTVVLNGADLRRFSPERSAPAALKESLGIATGDPILVVIGRLEPQKGHRILIEAMPQVLRQVPQARLVCVGDGSLRAELESRVRALTLQRSVLFAGFQSNVEDWLALADITVLPSLFEGLPLVAIESLAAGRPMVASAVDGTPEIVLHGETGLIVPPGDPQALAGAICRLLSDSGMRQKMSYAGRRWVLERFTEDQFIRNTQEVYLNAWEQYTQSQTRRTQELHKTLGAGRAIL